ncbi:MAG: potassium channel family protein [Salinimicrobium sediminis]|nr:potassium channel family protein [Salinimicrobium sediminis]
MQTVQIAVGVLIIVLIFLDFFHTTLSGNGFGIFSRIINQLLNRLILQNRNRKIFTYSGITHLLVTTFLWLAILFLGVFIIYTADEQMVVNGTTGLPATKIERFYFTGYVLSTLGIGDFVPGSETSRILTGILSFTGFVLITTGLTYLLSVLNAVLLKKQLSFFISTTGEDVEELFQYLKKQEDLASLVSDASSFRQQILQNSSSYLAFPMSNYFLSRERKSVLIVQLAAMYEVLKVVRLDWQPNTIQYEKITSIIKAIEKFLELGLEEPEAGKFNPEKLKTLRSYWKKHGYEFPENTYIDKQFNSSLQYAGWDWEDVYRLKAFQK